MSALNMRRLTKETCFLNSKVFHAGSKVPNSPQKSQALQHVAEESSCEFPDVPSPELKRRKVRFTG